MQPDIRFTSAAIAYIKKVLEEMPGTLGLRLGVKATGCSGWSYVMDFAKELRDNDRVFCVENFQVVVDENSLSYLRGMEIDCQVEGLNESLKFNNPNAKAKCGCGESFIV